MQNRNFLKKEVKELPKQNKNKKKLDLSRQFNEFKQRIQEFQDKNQEIIGRIRDAYSYKKKVVQNNQNYTIPEKQPTNLYYDALNEARSNDSGDEYAKRMAYEGLKIRQTINPSTHTYYYSESNNDFQQNSSVRHRKQTNTSQQGGQPYYPAVSVKSSKGGTSSRHKQKQLIKYGDYMRNAQMSNKRKIDDQNYEFSEQNQFEQNGISLQAKRTNKFMSASQYYSMQQKYRELMLRNEELQRQLQVRGQQIQSIRGGEIRFKSYSNNIKRLIEEQMDSYQQVFVAQKFNEIEKHVKKCQNKLKNLAFKLKDSIEDHRARQLITKSRDTRRSSQRSQAKSNLVMSMDIKDSGIKPLQTVRANSISRGPKKATDSLTTQKEFQDIASNYEVLIKKKAEENEKLQRQLREQVRLREMATGQVQKLKVFLQERQNQIAQLKRTEKRSSKQEVVQSLPEFREMKQRVVKLEEQVRLGQLKQRQLNEQLLKVQKSKKAMHEEYLQNLNKNKNLKGSSISELEAKIRQIEQQYQKQLSDIKQKLVMADRKTMQKQCEVVNLSNKLKKMDAECGLKQQKLKELQSLLLMQNEHGTLERSMSIDGSLLTQGDIQALQETIRKLDQQIQQKNNQIYQLHKQKYAQESSIKNSQMQIERILKLKAKAEEKANSLQERLDSRKDSQVVQDKNRQLAEKNQLISEFQAERNQLLEEKEQMVLRSNQLLEELKKLKQQNLAKNRQAIKLSSDLNFRQGEYASLQEKYVKLQQKFSQTRIKFTQLQEKKIADDKRYALQIQTYTTEMQNLKNHLLELASTGVINAEGKQEDLLNSFHVVSEISFSHPSFKKIQEEEVNQLRQQLKNAEAALEIKQSMEKQIQSEYNANIQQIKTEIADKNKQIDSYRSKIQELNEELKVARQQKREDESFEFYKISLYEQKIVQLQEQCNNLKESEERLNDMLHQIVDNFKVKQEEIEKMTKELEEKEKLIQELRELINVKEPQTDAGRSGKENVGILGDQSEEIDPADMSYFSNISQVFKEDGILKQKLRKRKSNREEQVKLFTKTSAYIKTLKNNIESKEKRIRTLEKQIMGMRSQAQSLNKNNLMSAREINNEDNVLNTQPMQPFSQGFEEINEFKDYDSVQLDTRKYKYLQNAKQLQYEKNLAIEQNKMLINQIELLQDQIAKAEQQQSNLMRIKDLYKDQIKKLMEKNQKHTQEFEGQIKKMRDEIEQSDSVHNWEAIKQLFIKIVGAVTALDDASLKPNKKEEKRKELEEYIKVMCSVLRMDNAVRDKLIAGFKR